jgi:hypothetical protein
LDACHNFGSPDSNGFAVRISSRNQIRNIGGTMKTVFVVTHGELYEGGGVVSVHASKEAAIKVALSVRTCFDGGWVKEETGEGEPDVWVNGCDFVQVEEELVR